MFSIQLAFTCRRLKAVFRGEKTKLNGKGTLDLRQILADGILFQTEKSSPVATSGWRIIQGLLQGGNNPMVCTLYILNSYRV